MANQYVNKVIYGNDTLIDISADTVTADKLLAGYSAHDCSGAPIVGVAVSGGYTVNFSTSNSDLYGATITIKQGSTVIGTVAFDNTGSASYTLSNPGTYTWSVTLSGETYTDTFVVAAPEVYIETTFVYRDWLIAGGLNPFDYANLAAVLADEEAVRKLMTIHAAVDYLASFEATDASVVTILNDNYSAKWISLTDYAMDVLEAAYGTLMGTIGKYGYGEWGITDATTTPPTWGAKGNVPVMTSASAPYGEVTVSSIYSSEFQGYLAFNGSLSGYGWIGGASDTTPYIIYSATNPFTAKKARMNMKWRTFSQINALTVTIEGSNTGNSDDWHSLGTHTFSGDASQSYEEWVDVALTNNTPYLKHRAIFNKSMRPASLDSVQIMVLQFYGRTLKVSVPKMSGNTTPYGEAFSNGNYSSSYQPYMAFDKDASSTMWDSAASASQTVNGRVGYTFNEPMCIKQFMFDYYYLSGYGATGAFRIEASNDGFVSDTNILYSGTIGGVATGHHIVSASLDNDNFYTSYRLYVEKATHASGSNYFACIYELNFYGESYSEREWDTTHPRRYLYDHGVEVETLTGYRENSGVVTKHPSELEFGIGGQTYSVAEFYTRAIDFTNYSLFRAVAGDKITDLLIQRIVTVTPYTANMHDGSQNMVATKTTTAGDGSLPNNISLDVTSLSGQYYAMVYVGVSTGTSYRLGTIKELWLE